MPDWAANGVRRYGEWRSVRLAKLVRRFVVGFSLSVAQAANTRARAARRTPGAYQPRPVVSSTRASILPTKQPSEQLRRAGKSWRDRDTRSLGQLVKMRACASRRTDSGVLVLEPIM